MPIPGNEEPGTLSRQKELRPQNPIHLSSAVPIKKRRFPIIQPPSPSPEQKPSGSEDNDSKNKQESSIRDEGDEKNTASPGNSDVSKTSTFIVKKEQVTPTDMELGGTNIEFPASKPLEILHYKPQEGKPLFSLGSRADLSNKMGTLSSEKLAEPRVSESGMRTYVKQEIVSTQGEIAPRLELSMGSMNVEMALGPKEPPFPALKCQNSEAVYRKSDKSDPSTLSLASTNEKLVHHDNCGNTINNVSSLVRANRSNWDLNTTMDAWEEGSTISDGVARRLVRTGCFSKANRCSDVKSASTTTGTVGLSLNKGKRILDHGTSNFPKSYVQPGHQCKTDVFLGLGLAMPYRELNDNRKHSLSDKIVAASVSQHLNLQEVQLSAMNVNRTVKSEPADETSKRDCSIGSCSSSNVGLSKLSSMKTELVSEHSLETVLPSSVSPVKLVDHRSIKSEAVEGNQEDGKCEDAQLPRSVRKVMQHQESCSSSSAPPVPSMPQSSCSSRLPTCSELTTCGDLSNQSELSLNSTEICDASYNLDDQIAGMVSKPVMQDDIRIRLSKVENSELEAPDEYKLPRVGERTLGVCQSGEVAANDEEKINLSAEILEEESFSSDCESQENCAIDTSMDIGENFSSKEGEDYEDGEVREPLQHSTGENPIVERKETKNLELVECDSQNLQPSVLGDQNINGTDLEEIDAAEKNHDETPSDAIKYCVGITHEPNNEDDTSQKEADEMREIRVCEKTSISPDKLLDASGEKDVEKSLGKKVFADGLNNGSHGIGVELGAEATGKVSKEICSRENNSTLSKVKASLNKYDATKDSNNGGNKSRIINLSRTPGVTNPSRTRFISNKVPASRRGRERYSDLYGEIHPRGNRDEICIGGSNKFVKDRFRDRSLRNSKQSFLLEKGRISGRFGSLCSEWDSDHDFVSKACKGPSDYRAIRRKHASPISDVKLERNGYGALQDDTALVGRRKGINGGFPSLRRTSLRRLSPGDRDGSLTRELHMPRIIPRNMSPSQCAMEDCSDMLGLRHSGKFMRHLSDHFIDPVYAHPQAMYDEIDGQIMRGNRNFSTLHRNGYPQIRSKSPFRSRTRSPGPWSSPQRRSPGGHPESTQHRSPALYRMGKMRSPDRTSFRDEMIARRRGSPSYVARHPNDSRDGDSGQEHLHPRSVNSNRRSSPERVFSRNARRADALDSQEIGDSGNGYVNGPLHSMYNELGGDGRRNFIERRGPRPFRPTYGADGDNFHLHQSDGPRPYGFCPDLDTEFVERSHMQEREFEGHIKHQPMVVSRRIRNIEEQQDGNFRRMERGWHDDGFTGTRMKRRRF